jgi:hypothetical protein
VQLLRSRLARSIGPGAVGGVLTERSFRNACFGELLGSFNRLLRRNIGEVRHGCARSNKCHSLFVQMRPISDQAIAEPRSCSSRFAKGKSPRVPRARRRATKSNWTIFRLVLASKKNTDWILYSDERCRRGGHKSANAGCSDSLPALFTKVLMLVRSIPVSGSSSQLSWVQIRSGQ